MTGLPNHDQREALPDSELDALLAAADADLLRYAEAKTDPARLLLTLMAADNGAELESRPSEVRSSDQLLDSVLTAESAAPARLLLLHRAVRAVTIADNASTDATWGIACRLSNDLDGVRTVHLSEKGRGRALRRVRPGLVPGCGWGVVYRHFLTASRTV